MGSWQIPLNSIFRPVIKSEKQCIESTKLKSESDFFGSIFLAALSCSVSCKVGEKVAYLVAHSYISPPPPGGTSLYKLYRYVPPYRVGFLRRIGLKTGIRRFAHFGLESISSMGFAGTTGAYECNCRFNSK